MAKVRFRGIRSSAIAWGTAFVVTALTLSREARSEPLPTPIDALGDDTASAFGGYNSLYFGAAIASTAVLVPSGGDHAMRLSVQRHLHSSAWGDAAYYGGYALPVVLPLGLWLTGVAARDTRFAGAGSAAIQAVVLTEVTVVLLKVGTGRPFPRNAFHDVPEVGVDRPGYSREFSPFGFSGRYAWPSGHTAGAFSLAAALTAYAGDSVAVPAVAYPIAAGIGVGMILGDHHWTSDVVAGALFGQAIGWSVGKSFRDRSRGTSTDASRLHIVPLVGGAVTGCAVFWEL